MSMTNTPRAKRTEQEEGPGLARSVPERTCVGCRETTAGESLERFVYIEGQGLIFDLRRKAPGRGVYVHARRRCLDQAVKRKGFSRGLKQQVQTPSMEDLVETMRQGIERRLTEIVQVAVRSQKVAIGQNMVAEAMQTNTVTLLFVAPDSSEGTKKKFSSNADRKGVPVAEYFDGAWLGRLLGREFISVVAVMDAGLGEKIQSEIEGLNELSPDEG
jgi:uncharacterized protein